MRPPSKQTSEMLDALNNEVTMIMGQLGKEDIKDHERDKAHLRLAEITQQMVSISKQGDSPEYIINLLGKRWIISRSYSSFWIEPRGEHEQYSVTEITGRSCCLDSGRGGDPNPNDHGWRVKLDSIYIPAHRVAMDICKEINSDLPAIASTRQASATRVTKTMGVFVSPTRVPPVALLAENLAMFKNYCAALVNEGNAIWDKTKDYKMVSDLSRDAVDFLGISTPWHGNLLHTQVCPGCGDTVRKGIVIHPPCGWILDEEKFKENEMRRQRATKQSRELVGQGAQR